MAPADPIRRIGAATAMLLVIANMVGTGVFTTTGFLVRDLDSALAVLLAWLIGGVLALCGALAYGELAAFLPKNGGEYQILSRVYHPSVGFVAGWISLLVGFSAPIAAASLAFGSYVSALAPWISPGAAAVSLLLLTSALHAVHVKFGSSVQNVFSIIKVLLIAVFIAGGLWLGDAGRLTSSAVPAGRAVLSSPFAIGLIFVSFAYSGWNAAVYIAGEVRRPERSLPIALIGGTMVVALLYLGLNAVFLMAAPMNELSGVLEIGHVAAANLFGARAGTLLSGMIALALVSSVSAMVMAGPRVYQAMGEDYRWLSFLSRRTTHGAPLAAVALQALVALVMILSASFESILTYIGFTLSLSTGLTVFGVFILRAREPSAPRPYRTWGYPLTPALFLLLSGWMVVHALWSRPLAAAAGIATVVSGMIVYWIARR